MFIYIYIYIFAGPSAQRRVGIPSMVTGSYFQLILGTPAAQKLGVVEYSMALFRPFGAPRLDFLVHREGVQKSSFFGIAPKHSKSEDKSNLGRPCRHFGSKNMTCEVSFGIICFIVLGNDQKSRKVFVFLYFSIVLDHQKSLIFRLFFHCFFMFFQNRSPGPFLEGPSAELL